MAGPAIRPQYAPNLFSSSEILVVASPRVDDALSVDDELGWMRSWFQSCRRYCPGGYTRELLLSLMYCRRGLSIEGQAMIYIWNKPAYLQLRVNCWRRGAVAMGGRRFPVPQSIRCIYVCETARNPTPQYWLQEVLNNVIEQQ